MAAHGLTTEIPRVGGSDLRKMFRRLRDAGCEWGEVGGGGHIPIYWQGRRVATISRSVSDHRAMRNLLSNLRREGVPV